MKFPPKEELEEKYSYFELKIARDNGFDDCKNLVLNILDNEKITYQSRTTEYSAQYVFKVIEDKIKEL